MVEKLLAEFMINEPICKTSNRSMAFTKVAGDDRLIFTCGTCRTTITLQVGMLSQIYNQKVKAFYQHRKVSVQIYTVDQEVVIPDVKIENLDEDGNLKELE